MYTPKVSIVIPAYNAADYLAEAIDSALAQSYPHVEIVVVNDGSADGGATAAVARAYEGRIRYLEKTNGGSSSALNRGIEAMTGEWFSWLSHDDLYEPNKLAEQIAFLNELLAKGERVEDHVLFSAHALIDAHGKYIYHPRKKAAMAIHAAVETVPHPACLVAEAGGRYAFHGCSCLVHREVLDALGRFNETLLLVNDLDLWRRVFMAGYRVHCLPDVLVKGRVHAKQVSARSGYTYHNPEQDAYWGQLLEWLLSAPMPANVRGEALYAFARTAYRRTRVAEGRRAVDALLPMKNPPGRVLLRAMIAVGRCRSALRRTAVAIRRRRLAR